MRLHERYRSALSLRATYTSALLLPKANRQVLVYFGDPIFLQTDKVLVYSGDPDFFANRQSLGLLWGPRFNYRWKDAPGLLWGMSDVGGVMSDETLKQRSSETNTVGA